MCCASTDFLGGFPLEVLWGGYGKYYGVATVSRINKIIGLFGRILSLLYGSFAKETYDFIDPTDHGHTICDNSYIAYSLI